MEPLFRQAHRFTARHPHIPRTDHRVTVPEPFDPGRVVRMIKALLLLPAILLTQELYGQTVADSHTPAGFADLVTEMKEIKHPYEEQEITAQAGIEF